MRRTDWEGTLHVEAERQILFQCQRKRQSRHLRKDIAQEIRSECETVRIAQKQSQSIVVRVEEEDKRALVFGETVQDQKHVRTESPRHLSGDEEAGGRKCGEGWEDRWAESQSGGICKVNGRLARCQGRAIKQARRVNSGNDRQTREAGEEEQKIVGIKG